MVEEVTSDILTEVGGADGAGGKDMILVHVLNSQLFQKLFCLFATVSATIGFILKWLYIYSFPL